MNRFRLFLGVFLCLALASSAFAGRYKLRFDPHGDVDISQAVANGCDVLDITGLIATGDRYPGETELRIDGVTIDVVPGPPFYWTIPIPEGGVIPAYRKFGNDTFRANVRDIVLNDSWFRRKHLVELYSITVDQRGRKDKNKADAPGRLFWFDQGPADNQISLDKKQLEDGHRQAYNQGRDDSMNAWQRDRDELLRKLQNQSDTRTHEETERISPPDSTLCPLIFCGTLEDPPRDDMVGETFVIYGAASHRFVAEAKVVQYNHQTHRAQFRAMVPSGTKLNKSWDMAWKRPDRARS